MKDLDGRVDLVLDSGPTTVGIESTVVGLWDDRPLLLRPGEVTREQVAEALGGRVWTLAELTDGPTSSRSPGQMVVHYAPRTPAYRLDRDHLPTTPIAGPVAFLTIGEDPDASWMPRATGGARHHRLASPEEASASLYARLHDLDALGLEGLLVIPPPDLPQWQAIRDRIWRATKPWPGPA